MKKTIYLAGLISTDFPQTFEWRKEAETRLGFCDAGCPEDGFHILSPLAGQFQIENGKLVRHNSPDGGITTSSHTAKDIILRDYQQLRSAHVVLCHLELFGSPRPMVGTMFELAWCWDHQIPVVGVAEKENYHMRKHPFVSEAVSHYFETVREACDFIREYHK